MRLKNKILVIFGLTSIVIIIAFSFLSYSRLWNGRIELIRDGIFQQLQPFDFALETFFKGVEGNVTCLARNERVRTRDDGGFTSFLHADGTDFVYRYNTTEQEVITIFSRYLEAYPTVSSVYMGRENGTFVRSHPREMPTRYDPRERPWYVLARETPEQVVRTGAYHSLTTPDINLGFVKALVDENGEFFGVVGIDVTLNSMAEFIRKFQVKPEGRIFLFDENGLVLASQESGWTGRSVSEFAVTKEFPMAVNGSGYVPMDVAGEKVVVFHHKCAKQGWTVAVIIAVADIAKMVRPSVFWTVVSLSLGLLLASALTMICLNFFVINHLKALTQEADYITRTGDLKHSIEIQTRDEIGELALSVNQMVHTLDESQDKLLKSERELTKHRRSLEHLVLARTTELKLAKEQIEAIFEAANVGIAVLHNNIVMRCNPRLEEIFGCGSGELDKKPTRPWYANESDYDSFGKNIENTIWKGDVYRSIRRYQRKDGSQFWASLIDRALDPQDRRKGLVTVIEDITATIESEQSLKKALEQAKEADRIKSAFLATMSHELRTPLNSIIGFTGILLQDLAGPLNSEQRKQLNMVQGSSRHLLALINDVLDLSKIEAGQMKVTIDRFDLSETIARVAESIRPLAVKKGLALNVHIAPEVGACTSDSRRVEQIILNLVNNAVKFTDRGEVSLDACLESSQFRLSVADTGIGIKSEDLGVLFQPFVQVDTGLTRQHEGTGLGLAICRRLADLLGGEIHAESEFGKGSIFTLTLPEEGKAHEQS